MECNTNRIRSIKLWERITEASMKLITEEIIGGKNREQLCVSIRTSD